MAIYELRNDNYQRNSRTGVGANSMTTVAGRFFVSSAANIISKATSTSRIVGVNYTQKAYAADNQTVAKALVEYEPFETDISYQVAITGGTVTIADQGNFFNLSSTTGDVVDGTTTTATPYTANAAAAGVTPVVSVQLQLVRFISATLGEFKIVNL